MCDCCIKPQDGNTATDPNYENLADYAAGVRGPSGPIALSDEELANLDDDEIDEVVSARAEEVAADLKKKRDDAVEREYRAEAHAEAAEVFRYHPATAITAPKHENVRNVCGLLAHRLIDTCPPSTELDTALDRLREVMFWANAAVALG